MGLPRGILNAYLIQPEFALRSDVTSLLQPLIALSRFSRTRGYPVLAFNVNLICRTAFYGIVTAVAPGIPDQLGVHVGVAARRILRPETTIIVAARALRA